MISELKWCAAAALAMLPTASWAQSAAKAPEKPAAAAPPPAKSVDELVVTGRSQQQDRVEIDRRSYSLDKNLQAQSGTLADLLRTIPSVEVDSQGGVSLRGDRSVTIQVDGKPSGMFRGESRATVIQSLPASQFERVEVITNPSAADSPEGGGGIINLITKQARVAGRSGSVRVGVGDLGQQIGGVNGNYNAAKLSVSGDLSVRGRDPFSSTLVEDRDVLLPGGASQVSRQVAGFDGTSKSLVARVGADYDLDPRTRIGVQILGVGVKVDQGGGVLTTTQDSHGALGAFDRLYDTNVRVANKEASASLRRKLGDDQELTAEGRFNRTTIRSERSDRNMSLLPVAPDQFATSILAQTTDTVGFKADYKNSFAGGELKLGYAGRVDSADLTNIYGAASTPAMVAADPARSGDFDYRLALNAVYVTLEKKVGDLTVLAGLRLEDSRTTITGAGERHEVDAVRPFPSLHLSYPLGEGRKISASYSRRIERPGPGQLSPLVTYGDRQNLYRGNPELRPQETDSFEFAYDARKGPSSIAATLFYRELHDAFSQVVVDQGGGVLLFTQDNLGRVRRAGLSLAGNRPLTPKLSLNVSGDAYWTEIPASALGFGEVRSGYVVGGRASLNWAPTASDLFQIDGRLSGKTLTPQGTVDPIGIINFGYRRKLTPSLFVNVAVQDVLDSNRQTTHFSSPTLKDRRRLEGYGRTTTVTLTYNFGSGPKKPRDPAFDFGAGGPPPEP